MVGRLRVEGYEVGLLDGALRFKRLLMKDIDFSGARMTHSIWESCDFENVLFDKAVLIDSSIWGCRFENVSFADTNLRDSAFLRLRMKSTVLQNVDFSRSDMRYCVFDTPTFERCDFSYANLRYIDFRGSRFKDCKFAGVVEEVRFRGYDPETRNPILRKSGNSMRNVDFSEAELRGVSFRNDINLSEVRFPQDENHLVLYHQREVYLEARRVIKSTWKGDDQRKALNLMKSLYLKDDKKNQLMDVYNKKDDLKYFGEDYANRFFNLLKEAQKEVLREKGKT